MPAAQPSARRADEDAQLDELQVNDASHLLTRLGADCAPLQFVRELTQNAFEGISMGDGTQPARVVWDVDWKRVEESNGRESKLSITDTGIGLTHEQMRFFVNNLAASGKKLGGGRANMGVGAKIAAGTRNPHGTEYRSWKDGKGALVRFGRHPDGRWGLLPQIWPDGHTDYWLELTDEDKPWPLRGLECGTQVTLLGDSDKTDTTLPPREVVEGKQRWLVKYANSRWLSPPDGVELLVREGTRIKPGSWTAGDLTRVHGQRHFLERRALEAGVLDVDELRVHWWILDEDHKGRRAEGLEWQSTGHLAALLDDEMYDMLAPTRGGYQRLQEWGIRHAYERVVLYLDPQVDESRLESNLPRTALLLDHQPLPWTAWGELFRANMPAEIRALQERVAQSSSANERGKIVATRLRDAMPALRIGRYRPPRAASAPKLPAAAVTADVVAHNELLSAPAPAAVRPTDAHGDAPASKEQVFTGSAPEPAIAAELVETPVVVADVPVAAAEPDQDEDAAEEEFVAIDMPDVLWISTRHQPPTRAVGDLEDRAARYDTTTHTLTINEDFRVFAAMSRHWLDEYRDVPGAKYVVDAVLKEWIETSLIEVVIAARNEIAGSPAWTSMQIEALTSEEALSAAALVRVSSSQLIRKSLGQRLGRR